MERLQAAIEKARQQRGKTSDQPDRTRDKSVAVSKSSLSDESRAFWAELEPIKLSPSHLKLNRVVSREGGQEAAAYDLLRTKMLQQSIKNGWRRIAITSADSGSGKSTTTANLAFCFERQHDLRVMVLDFDLRLGGLGRLLGQNLGHSMADVLEGRVSFAQHGLRYSDTIAFGLNNGPVKYPSELLQSHKTRDFLNQLEDTYNPDIILFDMPPLMASDDNFGFLKNVDCALLMVGAERTSMDKIDVAERQIAEMTNVMGIVLNKSRYVGGAYGYDNTYY